MSNDTIQARVDPLLKAEATAIFNQMGLKTAEAIRLFLQQSVNCGGLPFRPTVKTPNATTVAAMEEPIDGLKSYDDLDEMWEELGLS